MDLDPFEAAAIQSEGRSIVAKTVPESAAAQFEGAEPDRIFNFALAPIAVSNASSRAFRTATDNCIAIFSHLFYI
jgi:hypothetical protein